MSTSIKKNFLYNVFYQLLVIIIPLITTPYISRVLGAYEIGRYSYSNSVAQYFVLFVMLGLNNYGNRSIATIRDDKEKLSKTFWNIYGMQFICGVIVICLYIAYNIYISNDLMLSILFGINVVAAVLDINWLFFGLEMFQFNMIRNCIVRTITTICIFVFVKDAGDVAIYCLIMVLGTLISNVVLWPFVIKTIPFYKISLKEIAIHIKPNLLLFLTVVAVSVYKIMDKIMLGYMTNKTQVGFYESSERVIVVPVAFVTALGTVMLPRITNMMEHNDSGIDIVMKKSMKLAMFTSSSLCFGIMSVAKEFVPLFYGDGFQPCVNLFYILMPSCIFLAYGNVIRTQFLLPNKKDKIYVQSAFLGAIINLIINYVLIPILGATGAAIGTLFTELSVCIYQVWKVRSELNIKPLLKCALPFVFSGMIMFCLVFFIDFGLDNKIVELLMNIILGATIYLSISYIIERRNRDVK